jgi:hypothetical protein
VYTALGGSLTTGVTVYSDPGLTTPIAGYNYVWDGSIPSDTYLINPISGVIGAPQGQTCF